MDGFRRGVRVPIGVPGGGVWGRVRAGRGVVFLWKMREKGWGGTGQKMWPQLATISDNFTTNKTLCSCDIACHKTRHKTAGQITADLRQLMTFSVPSASSRSLLDFHGNSIFSAMFFPISARNGSV